MITDSNILGYDATYLHICYNKAVPSTQSKVLGTQIRSPPDMMVGIEVNQTDQLCLLGACFKCGYLQIGVMSLPKGSGCAERPLQLVAKAAC